MNGTGAKCARSFTHEAMNVRKSMYEPIGYIKSMHRLIGFNSTTNFTFIIIFWDTLKQEKPSDIIGFSSISVRTSAAGECDYAYAGAFRCEFMREFPYSDYG